MDTIKPTLVERLIAPFKRLTKRAEDEYQVRLLLRNRLAAQFGTSNEAARGFHIEMKGRTVLIDANFADAGAAAAFADAVGMTLNSNSASHISLTR